MGTEETQRSIGGATLPKEHNLSPELVPEPKEICEMPKVVFKITIIMKLNAIEANIDKLKNEKRIK